MSFITLNLSITHFMIYIFYMIIMKLWNFRHIKKILWDKLDSFWNIENNIGTFSFPNSLSYPLSLFCLSFFLSLSLFLFLQLHLVSTLHSNYFVITGYHNTQNTAEEKAARTRRWAQVGQRCLSRQTKAKVKAKAKAKSKDASKGAKGRQDGSKKGFIMGLYGRTLNRQRT